MTDEQKKKYLARSGVCCLYCESRDTQQLYTEGEDCGAMFNIIECLKCQRQWKDVFDLVDVLPIEAWYV